MIDQKTIAKVNTLTVHFDKANYRAIALFAGLMAIGTFVYFLLMGHTRFPADGIAVAYIYYVAVLIHVLYLNHSDTSISYMQHFFSTMLDTELRTYEGIWDRLAIKPLISMAKGFIAREELLDKISKPTAIVSLMLFLLVGFFRRPENDWFDLKVLFSLYAAYGSIRLMINSASMVRFSKEIVRLGAPATKGTVYG